MDRSSCKNAWPGGAVLRWAVDWDDLRFFLAVARRRTLSAAAHDLRVTQPTVGRRIAAFEHRLEARLFVRGSDGFALSAAGAQILAHAEHMEREALAAERGVSGRDLGLRGVVRVTASEWLVTSVLSPMLGELLARHPQLELALVADQRHLNLSRREADIALRPRRFPHAAVVQRRAATLGFGLYAAPRYLAAHGAPAAGDGRRHAVIAMVEGVGDVARDWLAAVLPGARCAVRCNGRDAMVALVAAGIGLACLARVVGDATPALHRVAMPEPPPSPALWLGVHRDARSVPRVRAVASYLVERLRAMQPALAPAD
jgi:DNA-binding transcriptional LysR family regulator